MFCIKRRNLRFWLLETGINTSKILWPHCVKEEKSWRWFDIRHSSWVWLKSRKKDFYVLFTNGYRTPGNAGSWKVDWQRKLFLGPDLRQNKNPLADLVLVLLVFLVLLFSALAAATVALRRRRRTTLHCRRNQPSILIKEILSFNLLHWQYQHSPGCRNWRGCRWGIRTPTRFWQLYK